MNTKPTSKKLNLHSETVRTIAGPELAGVLGGEGGIISPATPAITQFVNQQAGVHNTVYNTQPAGQNDTVHDTSPPRVEYV